MSSGSATTGLENEQEKEKEGGTFLFYWLSFYSEIVALVDASAKYAYAPFANDSNTSATNRLDARSYYVFRSFFEVAMFFLFVCFVLTFLLDSGSCSRLRGALCRHLDGESDSKRGVLWPDRNGLVLVVIILIFCFILSVVAAFQRPKH